MTLDVSLRDWAKCYLYDEAGTSAQTITAKTGLNRAVVDAILVAFKGSIKCHPVLGILMPRRYQSWAVIEQNVAYTMWKQSICITDCALRLGRGVTEVREVVHHLEQSRIAHPVFLSQGECEWYLDQLTHLEPSLGVVLKERGAVTHPVTLTTELKSPQYVVPGARRLEHIPQPGQGKEEMIIKVPLRDWAICLLCHEQNWTIYDISKKISQTPAVIANMIAGFSVVGRSPRRELLIPRSHQPWSSRECDVVYTMLCQGEDVVSMALALGRNINAVTAKWDKIKTGLGGGNLLLSLYDCNKFLSQLRCDHGNLCAMLDTGANAMFYNVEVTEESVKHILQPGPSLSESMSEEFERWAQVQNERIRDSGSLLGYLSSQPCTHDERVRAKAAVGLIDWPRQQQDPILGHELGNLMGTVLKDRTVNSNMRSYDLDKLRTTKIDIRAIMGIDMAIAEAAAVSYLTQSRYQEKQQRGNKDMDNIAYSAEKLLVRAKQQLQLNEDAIALRDRMAKAIAAACEDAVAVNVADVDKKKFSHFTVSFTQMQVQDNRKSFNKIITDLGMAMPNSTVNYNKDIEWLLKDFTGDNGGFLEGASKEFSPCPSPRV
jgi:hypothetical protein